MGIVTTEFGDRVHLPPEACLRLRHEPGELDQDLSRQHADRRPARRAAAEGRRHLDEGGPEGGDTDLHVASRYGDAPDAVGVQFGRPTAATTATATVAREGRMTVQYHFTTSGPDITLVHPHHDDRGIHGTRRCPTGSSGWSIPANIDAYHAAIARELGRPSADRRCSARRSAAPCISKSCWLVSQSGSSESNPWQVPGNTCSSVATPAHISRSA